MHKLHRTLIWKALYTPGAEYFNLWEEDGGWKLEGMVALALDGYPTQVRYHVLCNDRWETQAVDVEMKTGSTERTLKITVGEKHRWYADGKELRAVRGCVDVDLSITPATNTLPIRRLNLAVGENKVVTAAWVRFPELTVQTLTQKYIHVDGERYWYQSDLSDKVWNLEVDELGLVRRYADGWAREAVV